MDANSTERAQAYADEIRWRLEAMQYRCRYNPDKGTYRRLPTRIRRFHNGVPTDLVAGVLEELVRRGEVTGVVFNGEELDGAYRPTATQVRKDDSLKTGGDATYTILQDLLLDGESDLYQAGEGSACSAVSTREYHWDEAEVLGCPEGSQGVTYSIVDVHRDQATDLFSFSVRKVQAVTQHVPETVTACTDDKSVTTELWDNVYGQPGEWRWDPVVHDGGAVGVPEPCSAGQGTLVSLDVTENDDCTYKIKVVRTTSKVSGSPGAGCEFVRMRDWFRVQASDLVKNAAAPLSRNGVEVVNGVVTRYESSENDDGTWDNRVSTTAERSREGAARSVRRTLRATVTTVMDRSMSAALSTSGLGVGEEVRNELSDGGLWNRTRVYQTPATGLVLGKTCARTVFSHSDTAVSVLKDFGDAHAAEAGGGFVYRASQRLADDGTVEEESTTTRGLSVPAASVAVHRTLRGTVTRRTDRNQSSSGDATSLGVGESVRSDMTDGGLWDVTAETLLASSLRLSDRCSMSALVHEHVRADACSGWQSLNHATATAGTVREFAQQANDFGGVDVTETTRTALAASASVSTYAVGRTVTRTNYRNQPRIPVSSLAEVNREESASVRVNDYGVLDGEVTKVTYTPVWYSASGGSAEHTVEDTVEVNSTSGRDKKDPIPVNEEIDESISPNDHGSTTRRIRKTVHVAQTATAHSETGLHSSDDTVTINDTETGTEEWSVGATVSVSRTPNTYGSHTTRMEVRKAKSASETASWTTQDDSWRYVHELRVYRNWPSVPSLPSGWYQCSVSLSINEYRLYDVVVQGVVSRASVGGNDGSYQAFLRQGTESKIISYQDRLGKLKARTVTARFVARREFPGRYHDYMLDGAESGFGFVSHDNGNYGVAYSNITVGGEREVG